MAECGSCGDWRRRPPSLKGTCCPQGQVRFSISDNIAAELHGKGIPPPARAAPALGALLSGRRRERPQPALPGAKPLQQLLRWFEVVGAGTSQSAVSQKAASDAPALGRGTPKHQSKMTTVKVNTSQPGGLQTHRDASLKSGVAIKKL